MTRYKSDQAQYRCDWFSTWFRRALGVRRVTTDQLAEMTGIGGTTVRYYMTGARSPSLKTFLLILDKLGFELQVVEKRQ